MKVILFLAFLPLFYNFAFGQVKYEREYRLKSREVPKRALDFIDVDLEIKQLKWYKEESFQGVSIEAKFKIDKKKYSVEFDTLGRLEDIEVVVNKAELPASTLKQIDVTLSDDYKRFRIQKIQEQLKGDVKQLCSIDSLRELGYMSGYELIIKGVSSDGGALYECFFDVKGKLISRNKIVLNSTEHLEY